jgi:hypothetical protein
MIDLQEVVAFFRREKEVAEANKQVRISSTNGRHSPMWPSGFRWDADLHVWLRVQVAEMEAARHRATVQQLQKVYDQVGGIT